MYDTNTSLIIKTCKNKEWFEEQGLQFDRESRSIIAYPYGTHSFEIQDSKDNIILQGNKSIFLFADAMKYNPQDKYSLEFLDDSSIQWCMFEECKKYVLCPK